MSEQPQRPLSLVMRQRSQPNQLFPLHKDVLTLGRAVDNDIVIDDSEVSRHHARLTRRGDNWILKDLGSRTSSGELMHEIKVSYQGMHPPGVLSVAFSPDGTQVVAGVYGGSVQSWRVSDGVQTTNFQASSLPQPLEVHALPDGRLVTLNGYSVSVWQLDGTEVVRMESESGPYSGALSPDGQLLATVGDDQVELWDMAKFQFVHELDTGPVIEVIFSSDGSLLATLEAGDDLLRLWGVGG